MGYVLGTREHLGPGAHRFMRPAERDWARAEGKQRSRPRAERATQRAALVVSYEDILVSYEDNSVSSEDTVVALQSKVGNSRPQFRAEFALAHPSPTSPYLRATRE